MYFHINIGVNFSIIVLDESTKKGINEDNAYDFRDQQNFAEKMI